MVQDLFILDPSSVIGLMVWVFPRGQPPSCLIQFTSTGLLESRLVELGLVTKAWSNGSDRLCERDHVPVNDLHRSPPSICNLTLIDADLLILLCV